MSRQFMNKPTGIHTLLAVVCMAWGAAGLAQPAPTATIGDATAYIGTGVTVPASFANPASAETGYGPFLDVFLPVGTHLDFTGATYLGQPLTAHVLTVQPDGSLLHPLLGPLTGLVPGETVIVLELPFGSVTPGQPSIDVDIGFNLSPNAPVDADQDVRIRGGFQFGADPLNNPATDPPVIQPTPATAGVEPRLVEVRKNVRADDHDTPIGPTFRHTFEIVVDIAPGQTISNLSIIDHLPTSLVYLANSLSVSGTGISLPAFTADFAHTGACTGSVTDDVGPCAGTSLEINFSGPVSVPAAPPQAGSITVTFDFYISIEDAAGNQTGSAPTLQGLNQAAVDGSWPGNASHPGGGQLSTLVAPDRLNDEDQLEISNVPGSHPAVDENGTLRLQKRTTSPTSHPGGTTTYVLEFQVSDPSVFGSVNVVDVLPDGLEFIPGTAIFEYRQHGVTVAAGPITPGVTPVGFGQELTFDISGALPAPGLLLGACVPAGGGAPDCTGVTQSTTGVITYAAQVLFAYREVARGNVVQNDRLPNTADISGTVHNSSTLAATAITDTDEGQAAVIIGGATTSKSIVEIAGQPPVGPLPGVSAGDLVTFSLRVNLAALSFNDLVLTDYLPLPVFDVASIGTLAWGCTGPHTANTACFGPATDARILAQFPTGPARILSPATNSIAFDFGSYTHPVDANSAVIEVLLTVPVADSALADGLRVTNMIQAVDEDSASTPSIDQQITQLQYTRPVLNISNGVIAVNNTSITFAPVDIPVPLVSGTGTNQRWDPNFNLNATGLDAHDVITYLVIVENEGRGKYGAFDVLLHEHLPPGIDITDVDLPSVQIRQGDGSFIPVPGGNAAPLFDGTGLLLAGSPGNPVLARGYDDLGAPVTDGSNIIYITYDVRLEPDTESLRTFTTISEVESYSAEPGGQDLREVDGFEISDEVFVTIAGLNPQKSIVATSEAHTGTVGNVTHLAIGEIVRYRLVVGIPEGTSTNVVLVDNLPRGLRYLAAQGTQIAYVSAGTGVLSAASVIGVPERYETLADVPAVLIPGDHAELGGSVDGAGNSDTITIPLGNVTNSANDAPREYMVIEFNALVMNLPAADNNGAANVGNSARTKVNSFTSTSGPTDARVSETSNTVTAQIQEPRLRVRKQVAPAGNIDAGDSLVYTIIIDHNPNTEANATTAFDLTLTDVLPQHVEYVSHNVASSGGAVGVTAGAWNAGTRTLTVEAEALPRLGTITITINATLANNVPSNLTITNMANLTASSLPGTGTAPNPTGSVTPGASGANNGERVYAPSGSISFVTRAIAPVKSIVSTSEAHTSGTQVAVGEIVRYRIAVNIPEGVSNTVTINDLLPAGMAPIDLTGVESQTRVSIYGNALVVPGDLAGAVVPMNCPAEPAASTLMPDARITAVGNNLTFSFGDIVNNTIDDSPACVVIEFNALVLNVPGNNAGTTLTNRATASANNGTSPEATTTVTVVEPNLQIEKRVIASSATHAVIDATGDITNVDVGDTVTYQVVLSNPGGANVSTAWQLTIEDTLPAAVELVSGEYTFAGGAAVAFAPPATDIDLDFGALGLEPDQEIVVTYVVRVLETTPPGGVERFGQVLTNDAYFNGRSVPVADPGNPTGSTRPDDSVRTDDGDDSADITLAEPTLGLAKQLTQGPDALDGGLYELEFTFIVANTGPIPLTGVQVSDDLDDAFDTALSGIVVDPAQTTVTGVTLLPGNVDITAAAANPGFGPGPPADWNLFMPAGIDLGVGESAVITLSVRVALPDFSQLGVTFNNQAVATGSTPGGIPAVPRDSADGSDPTAPPSPTPVVFDEHAVIDVTKALESISANMDGSFDVVYLITLANLGEVTLSDVTLVDNLNGIYGATGIVNVVDVTLVTSPSTLTLNHPGGYDGVTDDHLLVPGSSTLAPATSYDIRVHLLVTPENTDVNYTNTVSAVGTSPLNQVPSDFDTETHMFSADPELGIGTCLPAAGIVANPGLAGNYDLTFSVHLRNFGDIQLLEVQAELDLDAIFASAAGWELVDLTADPGLIDANPNYGVAGDWNLLAADTTLYTAAQATLDPATRTDRVVLEITVTITPGATLDYLIQAVGEGRSPIFPVGDPDNGWLRDIRSDDISSDCVMDAAPVNEFPTPVNFPHDPLIGVAKAFTNLESVPGSPGVFDVEFTFVLRNYGNVPLSNVQLYDNLDAAFSDGSAWDLMSIAAEGPLVGASLVGWTPGDSLTDPSSQLGTAAQAQLDLPDWLPDQASVTIVVRVTPVDPSGDYENMAMAQGDGPNPNQPPASDDSTDGDDPDSGGSTDPNDDGDGDPTNNTSPTPFTFETPIIGVAKDAPALFDFGGTTGTQANPYNVGDGDYLVGYTFTLVNYGDVPLSDLVLTDDLITQLAVGSPVDVTAVDGTLLANPAYDGTAGSNILLPGQTLGYLETELVTETVHVIVTLRPGSALASGSLVLENQAHVAGTSPGGQTVEDDSNAGTDPDSGQPNGDDPANDGDGDPTNNDGPTVLELTENPLLAVSKSLVGIDNLGTGTYRIEFLFTLENQGDILLTNVQLEDDLDAAFRGSPFTLVSLTATSPLTAADLASAEASGLLLDASASQLAVGESATVTLVFDVTPGARIYDGPFENSATGSGDSPSGRTVTDDSNDGTDGDPPTPGVDVPTPIEITENPVIGVAKAATVTPLGDGRYDVLFTFTIRNYGDVEIRGVQLTDDLAATFDPGTWVVMSLYSPTLTTNAWAPDPAVPTAYDGRTHLNLLAGTDTMAVDETATVLLRVRVTPAALGTYENTAIVTGTSPGEVPVTDDSQDGMDPDPDGNDDPTDNDVPTPVEFGENPGVALAKAGTVTARADGTFDVVITFTVENTGDVPLSSLQITDPLTDFYANTNLTADRIFLQSGDMTVNPNYDGRTDSNVLSGTDIMPVGHTWTATLRLERLVPTGSTTITNSALATGTPPLGPPVDDRSNDGHDPDEGVDIPTIVELVEAPRIALAKAASLVMNDDATFTVTFTFRVRNVGNTQLLGIQVRDDLAQYYALTDLAPGDITVTSDIFDVNPAYDGRADDQLLIGNDQLAVGQTGIITLTLANISATTAETQIANTALASGRSPLGTPTEDPSNSGTEPDPGVDVPTIVDLRELPLLGIAKRASSVTLESDGTYTAEFEFVLRNYGNVRILNLSMQDDLSEFYAGAGLVAANVLVFSSDLPVNPGYTGQAPNTEMLGAGAALEVGDSATVGVTLFGLFPTGTETEFENIATGGGNGPGGTPTPPETSTDGPDPDPDGNDDPTDNEVPTIVRLVPEPGIATSKSARVTMNADGTYRIVIDIHVANVGNTVLEDVQVEDSLADFYSHTDLSPVNVTVGSTLPVNPAYDGLTVTQALLPGGSIHAGSSVLVTIVLDLVTPLTQHVFVNSALGSGTPPGGPPVEDRSNDGDQPEEGVDIPTIIVLEPRPAIGVAKRAEVVSNTDGSWDVILRFVVRNYGNTVLQNIQVRDDLTELYAVTDLAQHHISVSSADFTVNPLYNGTSDPRLLAPTGNSLDLGAAGEITLTLAGIRVTDQVDVLNTAIATAEDPTGRPVPPDASTDGDNPDPDGDGDPGNNDTPTPIRIGLNPLLGLAKAAASVDRGDGSYDITFTLLVRNYGDAPLSDLSITDTLADWYANSNLTPDRVSASSDDFAVNPAYSGTPVSELLAPGNVLQVGADGIVTVTLSQVMPNPGVTRIDNQALARGTTPDGREVSDTSTNGDDPDPDGRGPHEHSEPTPVFFAELAAMLLDKVAAPGPYTIGDRVQYTITITNPNHVAMAVSLTDNTPPATQYLEGTAEFAPAERTPAEGAGPRQDEPGVLVWRAIVVPAGESVTVTYELRILPGAESPLINVAVARGESGDGAEIEAQATAQVVIDAGVFDLDTSLLIGRVYLDVDRDSNYTEGVDVPLAGARVILSNGWQAITDEQGNYAFRELATGTWTVQVDQITAPYAPQPHPEMLRDPRQHIVQVRGLTVSDFPFESLVGLADLRRETTVRYGPITLHKYLVYLPDGVRVVLEIDSDGPQPAVTITDPVPGGPPRTFEVHLLGEPQVLTYDLPRGSELTDPDLQWSDR